MMLESKKYSIIEWIISIADEKVIDTIQAVKERIESQNSERRQDKPGYSSSTYAEIKSRSVNVEELKEAQNYSPTSSEDLTRIAKDLNIEQSIEELLADLKAMG
ncbi:MAG: hypothetical protein AAGJ93_03225 [Bacteroidota bacterium]